MGLFGPRTVRTTKDPRNPRATQTPGMTGFGSRGKKPKPTRRGGR
jgi:hypothetical protein